MSITENRLSIAFSAIDDDLFGRVMLNTDNEWGIEYDGLWEIDATADLSSVAACTYPNEGPGGAGLVTDGATQWETHFDEMAAYDVGVSETAEYVAVGGTRYSVGGESEGQPSVRLYDAGGDELWIEETEGEGLDGTVLDIGVSEETEVVAAGVDGPDGGVLRAFDLDGDELWSEDGAGGYIGMSRDGLTVVGEREGEVVAFDGESGDELWTAGSGWFGTVFDVADDGSRVLLIDETGAQAVLIDQGSIEWQANFAADYMRGALAGDGSAWSVIMGDNDAEQAIIQVY
jgi:outer membrane protein assembly factor BamB